MSPWTGIFRKAAKPKPDGRIRWFGKLPTYADYYSSVTDEEWALEFVDWVLRGYEVYQAKCLGNDAAVPRGAVAADHRRLPNCRLLVRLPQSGMTVLASLADYGGDMRGRPFPLMFYVGLPSAQCPGPTSDRVEAILRVFDGLSGLHREVVRFCRNPGQFESTFGDRELVLQDIGEAGDDSAWLKHAGSLQLAEWFAGAGLDSQMTAADWATRLVDWGEAIVRMSREPFEPTFCLPLSNATAADLQVAGWLHWLAQRMKLADRLLSVLVVGNGRDPASRLAVVCRTPVVDDFLLLTSFWKTLSYVDAAVGLSQPGDVNASTGLEGGAAPVGAEVTAAPVSWGDLVAAVRMDTPTPGG